MVCFIICFTEKAEFSVHFAKIEIRVHYFCITRYANIYEGDPYLQGICKNTGIIHAFQTLSKLTIQGI